MNRVKLNIIISALLSGLAISTTEAKTDISYDGSIEMEQRFFLKSDGNCR